MTTISSSHRDRRRSGSPGQSEPGALPGARPGTGARTGRTAVEGGSAGSGPRGVRGRLASRRRARREPGSEELERVELVQRNDPHAWKRAGEGVHVLLKVVNHQAVRLQARQLGVEELVEAQHADIGAGIQKALDLRNVVAVVRAEQDVSALAGLDARGEGLQRRWIPISTTFSSGLPDPASGRGRYSIAIRACTKPIGI